MFRLMALYIFFPHLFQKNLISLPPPLSEKVCHIDADLSDSANPVLLCNTSEHGAKALALSLTTPQERGFATTPTCHFRSWSIVMAAK